MAKSKEGQSIELTPEFLSQLVGKIQELDTKLDRSSGSTTVHRNAIERELAAKYSPEYSSTLESLTDQAQALDDEQRAAFVVLVQNTLEEAFGGEIDSLLDTRAKQRAEEQVPLSDDEEASVKKDRDELNNRYKAARNLFENWGMDVSNIPKPKLRRGPRSGSTRGPRQISRFDFTVNGMSIEKKGLNPIAQAIFGMKVSDFKNLVKETDPNIDLTEAEKLPDEWTVDLTHPETGDIVTVTAVRQEEYRNADEDEDEEGEVQPDETE